MISRNDVEHIARLARIRLSEAQIVQFERDLSGILKFVEKLSEVDTAHIEPLTGGTDLANVMREDVASPEPGAESPEPERLVEAAPQKRGGYVEVKAVFDR